MPKLTALSVENLQPGDVRREVPDAVLPGLYLVVQPKPSGSKSWAIRYRAAGRTRKHTLGAFPKLDLDAARDAARDAFKLISKGGDPAVAKKEAARKDNTVAGAWAAYVEEHLADTTKIAELSRERFEGIYRNHIEGDWKSRKLSDIQRGDVRTIAKKAKKKSGPAAANSVHTVVNAFLNWCLSEDMIETSPAQGIAKPSEATSRDRVLTDAELKAVWNGDEKISTVWRAFWRLLILTGARRNEVARMEWKELGDFKERLWNVPGERTKNGEPYSVYLTDQMLTIIAELPQLDGCPYVLTTNGKTPISGFSKAKLILDHYVKIEPWHLHDLRRTCATGMGRIGINVAVVEKAINHQSGEHRGIVKVYQRHDYADEIRQAFTAWDDFVTELVVEKPKADNVVRLLQPA